MRALRSLSGGVLAASVLVSPATAVTATANFTVTANVTATCVVSASALAFGPYVAVQVDTTAIITVTCTNGVAYTIALGTGVGVGATTAIRRMTSGAVTLSYAVFRETGRTTTWGVSTGTDTVSGIGTGVAQPITAFGRIPGGQYNAPGSYTDTVIVTVTY